MVDVTAGNDDAVGIVHPILRIAQVRMRIQVVNFAGRYAEGTDTDEADAVVGNVYSRSLAVILH